MTLTLWHLVSLVGAVLFLAYLFGVSVGLTALRQDEAMGVHVEHRRWAVCMIWLWPAMLLIAPYVARRLEDGERE